MKNSWVSALHGILAALTESLRSLFNCRQVMESSTSALVPGIMDLPPEIRIIIWKKLTASDQKSIRMTCYTFAVDIDGLVGVHGILDGRKENADWIKQVRLVSLHVENRTVASELTVKLHATICFNSLGRMLNEYHANLPSLRLTISNFNMEGFQGRLRNLEISTSGLFGRHLTEFARFLERQHQLTRLVCDLPTVSWSFYLPVIRNCRASLQTVELTRIPTMSLTNIDMLNWSKFPVIPNLKNFKLYSSTRREEPFPLQCLHTINFPVFHMVPLNQLDLINIKLREIDVMLIMEKTRRGLTRVNLRYYLTRIRNLHGILEPSLRKGTIQSLTLCDNLPVTTDQLDSNTAFIHTCRQYGYSFAWKYPNNSRGYGYKLKLKRN